jgi:LruC domain-containing protein
MAVALLGASFACKKEVSQSTNSGDGTIPDSFTFATSQEVKTYLKLNDHTGAPVKGIPMTILDAETDKVLAKGGTDDIGEFNSLIRVPSYVKEVKVRVKFPNLENDRLVGITNREVRAEFGGALQPRSGKKGKTSGVTAITPAGGNWYYMDGYDSDGVPNNLVVPGDVVGQDMLTDFNNTLPELLNIPANKPHLLSPSNAFDVHLIADGDVWVTFMAEGAGFRNTLGYYTYQSGNPPTAANQIDSVFAIFPNASRQNSGGGLVAGDKVYLGNFPAGTAIGWVLMSDGWNSSTQTIRSSNPNQTRFYSTYSFNPEPNATLRQHNVQLLDPVRKIVYVGFEDRRRDQGSDEDYNDMVFYATATPFSSLDTSNLPFTDYCSDDDDGDGVDNCDDCYRDDPTKAYCNTYTGTLGFEDLWPAKGDYDFNDLVIEYSSEVISNASNEVLEINTKYTMKALGGFLNNGFGVQFDNLTPGQIASVTGSQINHGLATLSGNGTEAGQIQAVAIVYDRSSDHMVNPGTQFINTIVGEQTVAPKEFQINVTLTTPINAASIGLPPYNPFMFVDNNRAKEVHLADKAPTDLADQNFFGQGDDDSNAGASRYYKTASNLPWGLHIDGNSYSYPVEFSPIGDAYNNFSGWATSNGQSSTDWYLDLPGYRVSSKIYQ